MGAQGDFERRREELAILQKGSMGDITDQMVVNSYVRGLEQVFFFLVSLSLSIFEKKKIGFAQIGLSLLGV